jgi:hypothetical protein
VVRRAALVIVALGACGPAAAELQPIVDTPADPTADPFANLDELAVEVAQQGSADDLVAATFAAGVHVSLPGVPYETNLVVHMTGRATGAEVAYGRTCSFDLSPDQPLPEPHLYLSRTVTWSAIPSAPTADRIGGSGWPAADRSVLFVGGVDASGAPVTQIDRYDPRTNTYATIDGAVGRDGPAVATLGDGRVVLVGGADPKTGIAIGSVDVVDPLATPGLQVETVVDARAARTGATAAALSDGSIAVIGGRDDTGAMVTTVLVIGVNTGQLTLHEVRADLAVRREGATVTRLGDDVGAPVLVVGGIDATGAPVAEAELYKPLQEAYSPSHPALIVPRQLHRAVLSPDGNVLVVGGVDAAGAPVASIELFAPDVGFTQAATLPATAGAVDFSITTLPDGRFLMSGGRTAPGATPLASAFVLQLDPLDGTVDVSATDALPDARAGHQSALLCDGTVLTTGGHGTGIASVAPARYDPPSTGRR